MTFWQYLSRRRKMVNVWTTVKLKSRKIFTKLRPWSQKNYHFVSLTFAICEQGYRHHCILTFNWKLWRIHFITTPSLCYNEPTTSLYTEHSPSAVLFLLLDWVFLWFRANLNNKWCSFHRRRHTKYCLLAALKEIDWCEIARLKMSCEWWTHFLS